MKKCLHMANIIEGPGIFQSWEGSNWPRIARVPKFWFFCIFGHICTIRGVGLGACPTAFSVERFCFAFVVLLHTPYPLRTQHLDVAARDLIRIYSSSNYVRPASPLCLLLHVAISRVRLLVCISVFHSNRPGFPVVNWGGGVG